MHVGDGKVGFAPVSAGWHNFEIGSDFRWQEKEGEETETLIIPFKAIEDSDEGSQLLLYCDLSKKIGKDKLGKTAYYTGISTKIAKKKDWVDLDDKDSDKVWKDEYFIKGSKLVMQLITQLPKNVIKGLVKLVPGKDKDGNDTMFSNLFDLDFYKKSESNVAETPTEETETADF